MLWEVDSSPYGKDHITGTPIKISYEEDSIMKAALMLEKILQKSWPPSAIVLRSSLRLSRAFI